MKKIIIILILVSLAVAVYLFGQNEETVLAEVVGKNGQFRLEIADTDDERQEGLMNRSNLCVNCGMLFVFPKPAQHGIWMKNMNFDLDVFWLAEDKTVVDIYDNMRAGIDSKNSEADALYVIELSVNTVEKYNIEIGDKFIW